MEKSYKTGMIYLISGRSAASWNIGRKIPEVTKAFNTHTNCLLICGGDVKGGIGGRRQKLPTAVSNAEFYNKWYRKNSIMNFFSTSYSEIKDLYHCWQTYKVLSTSENPKLIWERSSRLHWAGIFYAKRHHIPCVLEWKDHLVDYKYSLFHFLALYIEKWKNRTADYITVESEVIKKELASNGIDVDKIFVTYNAVDPEKFYKDENAYHEIRIELGIEKDVILVGYVGSYAFYHDSIRMLKAAKILRDKGITNIKWLLIGDGKDKPVCEKYAKENGLIEDKTVLILPFQPKEKIPCFLSAMDVTILPGSTDIICPIKVMEYMAAKSVVLIPDYECNREIIDGTNGLLFEPGSEESIAEMLISLSGNKELCKNLGESARRTVIEKLTWDKTYGCVLSSILSKISPD